MEWTGYTSLLIFAHLYQPSGYLRKIYCCGFFRYPATVQTAPITLFNTQCLNSQGK